MFVVEYLQNGGNATRAAVSAGYSPKTAYSQGHDLLKKPEIAKILRQRSKQLSMKAEDIRLRLEQIASSDPLKVFSWDKSGKVSVVASDELDEGTRAAIAGVKQVFDKDGRPVLLVEFHDKLKALALLAKFEGMENADPAGAAYTQNNVNVYLDSMTTEELKAIKKVMETPELAPLRKILVPVLEGGREEPAG